MFDGHGPYGHDISNFVHSHLPRFIAKDPNFTKSPQEALKEGFIKTHKALLQEHTKGVIDCTLSGTTATVMLHRGNSLIYGHVGDSRAIIAQKSDKLEAIELTRDHKPTLPDEKKRIY